MIAATRGGDGWLWYATGAVLAMFGGHERFPAILTAVVSVGRGILLFRKLKKANGRKRPCSLEPHCWATLPPDQFSFPSGHTITAFVVTLSVGAFYSGDASGLAVLRGQRGGFANSAGNALPDGRSGGGGHRLVDWDADGSRRGQIVRLTLRDTLPPLPPFAAVLLSSKSRAR